MDPVDLTKSFYIRQYRYIISYTHLYSGDILNGPGCSYSTAPQEIVADENMAYQSYILYYVAPSLWFPILMLL